MGRKVYVPKPRRRMTDEEREMALALGHARFMPGACDKRFARDISFQAKNFAAPQITEGQAKYLARAVIKYRRQIASRTVELATVAWKKIEAAQGGVDGISDQAGSVCGGDGGGGSGLPAARGAAVAEELLFER